MVEQYLVSSWILFSWLLLALQVKVKVKVKHLDNHVAQI